MSSSDPNYSDTLFQFPSLTKIHGHPNFSTLCVIFDKLQENIAPLGVPDISKKHTYMSYAAYSPPPVYYIPNNVPMYYKLPQDTFHRTW